MKINQSSTRFVAIVGGAVVALGLMFGAIATPVAPTEQPTVEIPQNFATTSIPVKQCSSTGGRIFIEWQYVGEFTDYCNGQKGTLRSEEETSHGIFMRCICN